jgi:ribose/xylose/arabinose/galactoside ABC-type transport system permease subunit
MGLDSLMGAPHGLAPGEEAAEPPVGARYAIAQGIGLHTVRRALGVWLGLVGLVIAVAILEPSLIEPDGLRLLLRQVSVIGLLAVGQTIVMLTAGIDLSVGSVVAVVNWIAASLLVGDDANNIKVIPLCLAIGVLVGLVNGVGIAKLRVPPFVMTLGMLFVVVAAGQWYTNGVTTGASSDLVITLGQGYAGPIPVSFLMFLGVALLAFALLRLTPYGRRVYAIGANPRAAHLAGVNTDRVLIVSYILCGLTAALGGLVLTGFIGFGATTAGQGFELEAIAAVVIGGTALAGGRGSVIGTVGGVLFLGLLFNLLIVSDIAQFGRLVVQGSAIVLAAALYSRGRRGR